jgi:hypothetical protein
MSGCYYDESEESLKRLAQRRKVLEERTALRIATLDEFRVVKAQSLTRLQKSVANQNIAAKERNAKLLNDISTVHIAAINNSINKSRSYFGIDRSHNSQIKDKLAVAKKRYHDRIEIMLPQYRQDSIRNYENEIIRMRAEKKIVEDRRTKLLHELQKEEMVKGYLDQERRGLNLSLGMYCTEQYSMHDLLYCGVHSLMHHLF